MEGIQTIQALKAVQSSLPAQTTIPSDELVMLYATDGTPIAKISRDDLVKAVASVMASNSQTTFSKLLGVQANGTPMGIGASDLASVLGASKGFYTKKINYASVDQGLVRIKVKISQSAAVIHTQISGGRTSGEPLDFIIGLYSAEMPKYNFVSGSGNCYYKLAGGYFEIIIAQNSSVDYSEGLVECSQEIVEAEIINRSGFDLSSYTLATDITFPQFYKNYNTLAELKAALNAI
jgi:hypothetical protein